MATNNCSSPISPEAARAVEEYLVGVGQKLSDAKYQPHTEQINGGTYVFLNGDMRQVHRHLDPDYPVADPIKFFTLNGLIDYITTDIDGIFGDEKDRHIVRVTNEKLVEVLSRPRGLHKKRHRVAYCEAPVPAIKFGVALETEEFQTMLQTCFEETENRQLVLDLAGSVKKEQSIRKSDDGMAQTVTVKDGVHLNKDVTFKNPVNLTPLRTFYEVPQPSSPFVLRFDENGRPSLHDGDGGAWKLTAVRSVTSWLEAALHGCNVSVIG